MNVVVPMAGAGARFAAAGYTLPKPLIPVDGVPMYRWAVDSLPLEQASRLVFVLREDAHTAALVADIDAAYAPWKPLVRVLPALTRGQAETVALARDALDQSRPVLIHNADTAFVVPGAWDFAGAFGELVTFRDTQNRWSYARLGPGGDVAEVREKAVISDQASTGTYWFADTRWLLARIDRMIEADEREQGEFYLAPLYNDAIAEGRRVTVRACQQFCCLGTPADLAESLPRLGALREALAARKAAAGWPAATGVDAPAHAAAGGALPACAP